MHRVGGDGDAGPTPEQMATWRRRMARPDNEVPVAVPVSTVLVRNDEVAVLLGRVETHTTGLALGIAVRLRREPRGSLGHRVLELIGEERPGDGGEREVLLVGLEHADGTTVVDLGHRWPPDEDDRGPVR